MGNKKRGIPELRALLRVNRGHIEPTSEMQMLTETHGISTDDLAALDKYELEKLRVIARAQTARKATIATRSAAMLWGMPILRDLHERDGLTNVEMVRPNGSNPTGRSQNSVGVTHFQSTIPDAHLMELHGIRVTRPSRTAFDLVRKRSLLDGVIAMDWLVARAIAEPTRRQNSPSARWTREVELLETLLELKRIRGIPRARLCYQLSDPRAESPLESIARIVLVTSGFRWIESVQPQAQLDLGATTVHTDFLINDRIALEIDGAAKYFGAYGRSTDAELRYERDREKRLQNAGYLVLRVGAKEVFADCAELRGVGGGHGAGGGGRGRGAGARRGDLGARGGRARGGQGVQGAPPAMMVRSGSSWIWDANSPTPNTPRAVTVGGMLDLLDHAINRSGPIW